MANSAVRACGTRLQVVALLLAVVQGPWASQASSLSIQPNAKGNTSCPWRFNLIDGGNKVERCIDELSITFPGAPSRATPDQVFTETPPDGSATPLPGYKPLHGGNLYKLHPRPASWHAAKDACEREGAHLVVVDSVDEVRVVRALLGLRLHDNSTVVHAGFYVQLVSVHGETLPLTWHERWVRGDPNAPACGQMDSDGFLMVASCTDKRSFICEYESLLRPSTDSPLSTSSTPLPWNPRGNDLPKGFEAAPGWNNSYYQLTGFDYNSYRSWNFAEGRCEKENAHLASVESEEEMNAIVDMLQNKGMEDESVFWKRIYFGVRTGELVTVLGDLVHESGFSRWGTYSSLKTRDGSLCFWVDYKLFLHSIDCFESTFSPLDYLCEIVSSLVYE